MTEVGLTWKITRLLLVSRYINEDVQSTARQSIQNCQTSAVDFRPHSFHNKAQI
jgi:hypothetical protein